MRARAYKRRVSTVAWGLILFAAIACWSLYSAGEQGMYAPQPAKEAHSGELPWNLTLVNRWNPLPEDYDLHLVDVPGGKKWTNAFMSRSWPCWRRRSGKDWGRFVASGYRTQEKQQSLYDEKIQEYRAQGYSAEEAVRQAQRWVAVPGTSEHQLGIAVDINGAVWEVYPWLQANSYKYGFIFRYPGEKTSLTGTAEEVWHYRYVGVEAAAQIYERGLCLEEYLETL